MRQPLEKGVEVPNKRENIFEVNQRKSIVKSIWCNFYESFFLHCENIEKDGRFEQRDLEFQVLRELV